MPPQTSALYRIQFHPGQPEDGFDCPADLTVLRASLREGGGLLSSCRAGTCRACMRRLLSGQVEYLIEWPGLSAEEKAEGWFLPCVARPCSDLRIEAAADESLEEPADGHG